MPMGIEDNSSTDVLSSQVTLVHAKLIKINQHTGYGGGTSYEMYGTGR